MKDFAITVGSSNFKSAVYLKDLCRYVLLKGLDEVPRAGTDMVIDGERWRVVEWTNNVEGP